MLDSELGNERFQKKKKKKKKKYRQNPNNFTAGFIYPRRLWTTRFINMNLFPISPNNLFSRDYEKRPDYLYVAITHSPS